ncbi:MAG: D-2-hydroxyacid dehydrogenase [Acidobacteria bacterium]|nr:D-2-hydroxyacid dehydrogenase [Acidobacteriota bacterium]
MKIWCNALFPAESKARLRDAVGDHHIVFADDLADTLSSGNSIPASDLPADADVAFGQPSAAQLIASSELRWAHLNSAGYTAYDSDDFRETFTQQGKILTNSSDVYAEPTAEHVVAMIYAQARQLPQSMDNQRSERGWPFYSTRAASRLLKGQTALLLGFGHIAQRVAELLSPLGMNLVAVRRTITGNEPIRVLPEREIASALPLADHIVNILPASPETKNFLNAERLALIKPGAILYNVGRGTTVDQAALRECLLSGRLAAAYLDVTEPEPLPPDDPLWTTPNCFITPHSGGGHSDEMERLVEHFLKNLQRFTSGQALLNRLI